MIDIDLLARVNHRRVEQGQGEMTLTALETVQIEARRALCEELDNHFDQEYTIAIVSGLGTVYNLAGSINVDLLWTDWHRARHADGTEISVLPWGCSSRDLTYPRFEGYYWAVVEAATNKVTITVMQGDGETAAPDGNVLIDFATVKSLANWAVMHESALVAKCLELSISVKAEAA